MEISELHLASVCCRQSRAHGGVAIYTKSGVQADPLDFVHCADLDFEIARLV